MIDNQHLLPTMNPHQNMIMLMRHKGHLIVKNMTGVESKPLLTLYIVPNYKHHCKFFRLSKCPKNGDISNSNNGVTVIGLKGKIFSEKSC